MTEEKMQKLITKIVEALYSAEYCYGDTLNEDSKISLQSGMNKTIKTTIEILE